MYKMYICVHYKLTCNLSRVKMVMITFSHFSNLIFADSDDNWGGKLGEITRNKRAVDVYFFILFFLQKNSRKRAKQIFFDRVEWITLFCWKLLVIPTVRHLEMARKALIVHILFFLVFARAPFHHHPQHHTSLYTRLVYIITT